jgi:diguanylate cyclase (GGDEF)-like protein
MIKALIIFCFFVANILFNISLAESHESTGKVVVKEIQFNLSNNIVELVEESISDPKNASVLLQKIKVNNQLFNYAEQYLLLLTSANVKQYEQQHTDVIHLLEEAKLLTKYIAQEQLALPMFLNVYLVLAHSYEAIKDYEKAYQNKQFFVDEYNNYRDAQRENNLIDLTEKYEVSHKIEENKLLDNQNKLKGLRIDDVHQQQIYQQRKFIVIFGTILLFILLFVRQLKVRKKLLLLSKIDSLTGLLNRAELFKKGNALLQEAQEKHFEISVLLFDIDHFKLVNDQFGHGVGDLVLKKIASLVNETMRARDVFARLGGEEFVSVLPKTDIDQAKGIAVRVLEKIAHYNFSELGVDRSITLSIGVANVQDTNAKFDDIIHAADIAMYQAKAQGRNQMVSYRH